MAKKLFLLDGHALIYRAHFSFIGRPLMNSKGWNVSAIQGFIRTLWDMMQHAGPTHIAVVFDPNTTTFRHEKYEPYKANREAQPDDIAMAIPWVKRICKAMRIPVCCVDNYEADDVIGTIAKQAAQEDFEVFMVTPDKDFGQLVDDRIKLYKPGRQGNEVEIWGVKEVCARWGIRRVEQVIDMLALMGDSVDNIPGLPGIGEKTATKLLEEFDTVENLLANVDKLKGKQQDIVRAHGDKAILSKWLATIDTNAPIHFKDENYEIEPFDREALIDIFKELEFRSLAEAILRHPLAGPPPPPVREGLASSKSTSGGGTQGNLFGDSPEAAADGTAGAPALKMASQNISTVEHTYYLADTPESRAALIARLEKAGAFCYDTETTALDATQADLVGFSFALQAHEAWYVPVPADRAEAQQIVEEFRPLFENEQLEKIGQNLKYDAIVLKNYGVEVRGPLFDTMLAHYLLEPENRRHGMDYMAETLLDYTTVKIEDLIGKKGAAQGNMRDVPVEAIQEYAAEDADITLQLHAVLAPKIEAGGENLVKLFREVETPLVSVLAAIEHAGVRIDPDFLKEYSVELSAVITDLEKGIMEKAGFQFHVGSPKQVGEALFDRLKIPYPGKKMKSGQYSTDEEMLSSLTSYPIAADILQHRGLMKLKSTYIDALPLLVNPRTGRVHSSFNQAVASTGRLSSQNPNLQNIPVRTAEGRRIREAFIPRDAEHIILSADYSQIELRLIADIAQEEAMLSAFQQGLDIHLATAARVYAVPLDQVLPEQRRAAKTINFAILYGAGATTIGAQLGIKRAEAKELIDNYFQEYPGLKNYMTGTVRMAREKGYVETLLGRRSYYRNINGSGLERARAELAAMNAPIQGTAADMIKIAMVNIHREMEAQKLRSNMILQVHDELVFDARKDELEQLKAIIFDKMTNALPGLKVPILVEMGTGENWLEAH